MSYVQTLVACALVALAAWAVQQMRVLDARADAANARQALAQERAARAELWAEFESAARAQEAEHRRQMDAIAEETQRKLDDAQATADRVVADLRAGERRVRHEIAALHTARLSADAATARELDAAAQRGADLIAAAVGVGARCDAVQRGLIQAYELGM